MYAALDDPYCYPGTSVLRNNLDITDKGELEAFEADIVVLRAEEPFPEGDIGPLLFRAFHRHLFQDVYAWAGDLRTVRIHKDDSTFCYPEHIEAQLDRLFAWLSSENFLDGLTAEEFAEKGAHFLSEINVIHAFREGNGRAQMAFFTMLAGRAGHPLNLDRLDPKGFLDAMVGAFNGNEVPLALTLRSILQS